MVNFESTGHTNTETKEESESFVEAFTAKLEELEGSLDELKRFREVTFDLHNFRNEGMSTIIAKYGAESLFTNLETAAQHDTRESETLLQYLRELEPDTAARSQLYEQMISDSQASAQEHESTKVNEHGHFNQPFMYGENYARTVEASAINLRNADSVLGRVRALGVDDSGLWNGYNNMICTVGQYGDVREELLLQFTEHNNDLEKVVESRQEEQEERERPLSEALAQLMDGVVAQIDNIEQQLTLSTKERQGQILGDLEQVVETAQSTSTEEARMALQEAIMRLEGSVNEVEESANAELEHQVSPYKELLSRIESHQRNW